MREITIKKTIPNLSKKGAANWARFTKESNERFRKMTPNQKRVTVAEDVIKQLEIGALVAEHGTYVEPRKLLTDKTNEVLTGLDLDIAIPYFESCDVCAVGSLMICTVMRDDKVVYDGNEHGIDNNVYGVAGRFFSEDQVRAMESIFENWENKPWSDQEWFPRRLKAEQILTLIMQSVIDSRGSFDLLKFGAWLKKRYTKKAPKKSKEQRPSV